MIEHLYQCSECGNLTPFPKKEAINPPRRSSLNKEIKITNINQSTEVVLKAGLF